MIHLLHERILVNSCSCVPASPHAYGTPRALQEQLVSPEASPPEQPQGSPLITRFLYVVAASEP